jgi:hypothetical protein
MLVTGATTAAAATASTREPSRGFGGSAIARSVGRAENGELNRIPLARALRTRNFLRLVQHNLLKVRLAIFANVFVNGHVFLLPLQIF